ncbi:hypothetical protein PFICI_07269 [Pestalotiopsis fici W106-1]|uniref:F-box domain-containing protein n=1 Tax=Pestalotiopsis fici (strain W106-1 / CGMCC3.15140) TaxID=1229662 RepID=W3XA53_PESFW|nr:uncharacterized protein PFICI_07269 [Pestalotiopsis fici W106-1]ETS82267.1 hypothetical protein PFICI_07269 [Pestalotiopsis fici W106-1]
MATMPQAFFCLWQDEHIREILFDLLPKEDICNVRLASSACCNLVTKRLFLRTNVTFNPNTFTKQSRIQALSQIGHHIEHLTFYFPHSDATFLPPLIHPETGREISFLYTPYTSMASAMARPKFANSELGEILTQQYPPLFHAASNVPSFINAMRNLSNVRHITIKTPGQDPKERYRRDIVDYALISLRISLERAPLPKLMKLSLSSVHPSAFTYLRHVPGFGCTPSAGRRWKQIRKLHISAEAWDFYGPSPGLDHLKIIEDYIRNFSDCLEKLTFTWIGRKGPCPIALAQDPLFAPPRSSQKLFQEVTSPMSPLPPAPSRKPIKFRKLRNLSIRNATMNAPQVAELISSHQQHMREFDFENVVLINDGSWDDALAPLMDDSSRNETWTRNSVATFSEAASLYSTPTVDDLPLPSPAMASFTDEIMSVDHIEGLDGLSFYQEPEVYDHDLPSDLESARQASVCSSTVKGKRLTKRRRRRKPGHEQTEAVEETREEEPHTPKASRFFRRQKSEASLEPAHDLEVRSPPREPPRPVHYRSRSTLFGEASSIHSSTSSQRLYGELESPSASSSCTRLFGEITPSLSSTHTPTDAGSIDEYFRPITPIRESELEISAPILNTQPSMPALLHPTIYDPTAELCGEISAVQRDLEAEEAQRALAEDPDMRMTALKKAKETVMTKLTEQFAGKKQPRKENTVTPAAMAAMGVRFQERLFGRTGSPPPQTTFDHQTMDVPILFTQ